MVARAKEQTTTQWDYVSAAVDSIEIDEDVRGPFARVASQSGPFRHQVRFVEPARGEHFVPYATHCSCQGFKFRKHCIHCDVVGLYYEMIYDHSAPIFEEEVAPVAVAIGNAEMDQLVARLEIEFGLGEEVKPVAKPKKIRRSAKNAALIAELQVTKKVTIAQVRKAMTPFVFRVGDKEARGATAAEALLRALSLVKASEVSPACPSVVTQLSALAA